MVIKNGMDSREFLAERETSEVFVFTTGILKRSLKLINNNIKDEGMDKRNNDKGNKEFKKIEEMLYNYFNKKRRIDALKHQIKILDKQIEKIDRNLRSCNITIEEESSSLLFDERVQTSSNGISYAEREVMKNYGLKDKEKAWEGIREGIRDGRAVGFNR